MNKFICQCGKITEKDDEHLKWNKWARCECGEKAFVEGFVSGRNTTFGIEGYSRPGYNEGLGVNIKSKQHLKQVLKERNLKEAG